MTCSSLSAAKFPLKHTENVFFMMESTCVQPIIAFRIQSLIHISSEKLIKRTFKNTHEVLKEHREEHLKLEKMRREKQCAMVCQSLFNGNHTLCNRFTVLA